MISRKILQSLFALLGVALGLLPLVALATTSDPPLISLEVPIAGQTTVLGIAGYIELLYRFAVSSIGIAATLMIMWGGFKWISAAGNSQKISDAQDTIYNALIGLMLGLLSYTLLYVINPAFVDNEIPNIEEPQSPPDFVSVNSLINCNHPSLGENACKSVPCGEAACPYAGGGVFCRPDACSEVDDQSNPRTCQLNPEKQKYECLSNEEVKTIRDEAAACVASIGLCGDLYETSSEQKDCYCDMYLEFLGGENGDLQNTEAGYNTCTGTSCGDALCYPEGTTTSFVCKAVQ